jgi:hypothetical protein
LVSTLRRGRSVIRDSAPPHCPSLHIVHTSQMSRHVSHVVFASCSTPVPCPVLMLHVTTIHMTLRHNPMAVHEFLELADSFPSVLNHEILLKISYFLSYAPKYAPHGPHFKRMILYCTPCPGIRLASSPKCVTYRMWPEYILCAGIRKMVTRARGERGQRPPIAK